MTEIASLALSAVGAQIILGIFGLTWILKIYLRRKLGHAPDELILSPWILSWRERPPLNFRSWRRTLTRLT